MREGVLIDEAEVEHAATRRLIEELKQMDPDDEKFSATFKVQDEERKAPMSQHMQQQAA